MEGSKIYEESYKSLIQMQKDLTKNNQIVINFSKLDNNSSGEIRTAIANYSVSCSNCGFKNKEDCSIHKARKSLSGDIIKIDFIKMGDYCSNILKNNLNIVLKNRASAVFNVITGVK